MMPNPEARPAPSHLTDESRALWDRLHESYEFDEHHARILALALEALQRCREARLAIDEHGLTYTDRFGAPRLRPEVAVERDSRLAVARLLRDLNLDGAELLGEG
jgi:phage terminase small subunit